jgi:hypothetical protein
MRNSFRGFGKTARAAVKSQARPAFGDRHRRSVGPDGAASTSRAAELERIVTETS